MSLHQECLKHNRDHIRKPIQTVPYVRKEPSNTLGLPRWTATETSRKAMEQGPPSSSCTYRRNQRDRVALDIRQFPHKLGVPHLHDLATSSALAKKRKQAIHFHSVQYPVCTVLVSPDVPYFFRDKTEL